MKKSQQSPTISILVLFPLLSFVSTIIEVESRILQETCSSSCGDIKISYPFRLKTDPAACGDADYVISCDNNRSVLEFHSGKYYVQQISYDNHIIRLVDVNLANGTCNLPYMSVSADELRLDSRYRGLVSSTFTSFVKCSSEIDDRAYREVPCLSGNDSYVYVSYSTYVISDLQGSCSFISRVPTIYQNVLYPSYQSILLLMALGFDLEWSVVCRDCIADGNSCTLSSTGTPNVYECHYSGTSYILRIVALIFAAIWNFLLVVNLIARFILAPIVVIGFLVHKYRTEKKTAVIRENLLPNELSLIPRRYSYSDVIAITNNLKDKIGKGGFGTVYKGQLPGGHLVAVKMLGNTRFSDEDFINEVSTISKIHHVNVLRLLGFCSEGPHRALFFEYMAGGSLDNYILSREVDLQPLSWEKLLQIAIGTARGIEHLHTGCDVCILHFDIKPHNVLLDTNFIPKVSDFGLAKFYPKENDFVSVNTTRGTMGYIAPELISKNIGAISCKSDVYSFGMLLLEMVRGRRDINAKGNSGKVYFPSWVYDHLNEIGDLELENVSKTEAGIAKRLCVVGLWCIQKNASERPFMTKVVEMLEGNIDNLQLPPSPLSFPDYVAAEGPQSDSSTELLISETVEQSS